MVRPGEFFAGFEIERELGRGGMGAVYLAKHPRLPRRVALKVLGAEMGVDAEGRARFEREGEVVARLDHPNIVAVYDRGVEDDRLWIAMRYVDGMDAAGIPRGSLTAQQAILIASETARALDYAHAVGVVHRDVKPGNILLARPEPGHGERVLLTDFGIARLRDDAEHLTRTGTFLATLAYASPEQLSALPSAAPSDQYSLACTLYCLLTGVPPFHADNVTAVIAGHLHHAVPPASSRRVGLPSALDAVLGRALAKRPEDRFPTCTAFTDAARSALDGASFSAGAAVTSLGYFPSGGMSAAGLGAGAGPSESGPESIAAEQVPGVSEVTPPAWGPAAVPGARPTIPTWNSPGAGGPPVHAGPPRGWDASTSSARSRGVGVAVGIGAAAVVLVVIVAAVVLVTNRSSDSEGTSAAALSSSAAASGAPKSGAVDCVYRPTTTPAAKSVRAPEGRFTAGAPVQARLDLTQGSLHLTLDSAESPCTVNSFVSLSKQGYFDGTSCHRITTVTSLRVVQCGDPTATGTGGPGYAFDDEYPATAPGIPSSAPMSYPRGTVAMANAGPGTNGSQFFLVWGDSQLPPNYTIFGAVSKDSLTTLDKITAGGSDESNGPGDGKPVTSVTVQRATVG